MEFFVGLLFGFIVGAVTVNVTFNTACAKKDKEAGSNVNRLKRIFQTSEIQTAPNKVAYVSPHYVVTVGIGNDHTASIFIGREDLDALAKTELPAGCKGCRSTFPCAETCGADPFYPHGV